MKHWIRGALLALGLVCMLTSCNGEEESSSQQGEMPSETETEAVEEVLVPFVVNGATDFTAIQPEFAAEDMSQAILAFYEGVQATAGIPLERSDDYISWKTVLDPAAWEFYLGPVRREESEATMEGLGYRDFRIAVIGHKVVLTSPTGDGAARGVEYFLEHVLREKDGNYYLPGDGFFYEGRAEYAGEGVTVDGAALSDFTIVLPEKETVAEYRAAVRLQEEIAWNTGAVLPITDDSKTYEHELRIGRTARTTEVCEGHDYLVSVNSGHLQLLAGSYYGYEALTEELGGLLFAKAGTTFTTGELLRKDASTDFGAGGDLLTGRTATYRLIAHNVFGICSFADYPYEQRAGMLALQYAVYDPDVLLLQEYSEGARDFLEPLLIEMGYTEVVPSGVNHVIYTPVYYRADRFTLLESGHETFAVDGDSKQMTWAVLEDKSDGTRFAALSTHFYHVSKSSEAEAEYTRLTSAELVTAALEGIAERWGIPTVVGGDLNCNQSELAYKHLDTVLDDAQLTATRTEDGATWHNLALPDKESGLYLTTTKPGGSAATAIDHLFVSDDVTAKTFDLVTEQYALLGSDHCPLMLDFDLPAAG